MAPRKKTVTPEDLERIIVPSQPQISPDGETVLYCRRHAGPRNTNVRNLWAVPASGGSPRIMTSGDKDSHGRWSPDGSQIAFLSGRGDRGQHLRLLAAGGGESRPLTSLPEGSFLNFKWSPDGRSIAFLWRAADPDWTEQAKNARKDSGASDPPRIVTTGWYRLDGDGYFLQRRYVLKVVDIASGQSRTLWDKDGLGFMSYDWSPDSSTLAITTVPGKRAFLKWEQTQIRLLNVASGRATTLDWLPDGPKDTVCWSPDGSRLAWSGREGTDGMYSTENLELWVCQPKKKGSARCLSGKTDLCLMAATLGDTAEVSFEASLQWTRDSKAILARIGIEGAQQVYRFKRSGGLPEPLTSGRAIHDPGNLSADGTCLPVMIDTPTTPPEVYLMDLRGQSKPRRLTNENAELRRTIAFAAPKSFWVSTEDGTRVQTWMITPPGVSNARRKPAVLQIHGGPHAQYGYSFFHEFQCQAAKGMVVVYSNPRGSKGYGRDHCAAIRGDWGSADWVDIRAVIDWMRDRPEVDPKRMAIMGGSYGGYMTNWAIGHTNEFACAITDRCVSNLVSMGGNSDFMSKPDSYFPGNAWDRPEDLWKCSPIRFARSWKTPTLVIHSEGDLRCNVEQAEQVWTALQVRNIPSRFVRYPASTSHGMSRGGPTDLRIHRLHEILTWLNRYIGTGRRKR
ncbi:MAG: S9 family peptidase [Phycisphaerales bacterium]|jgi:dipeptidyl aminopeptidase/acylaminoacyl peptidase|nr:S9 family peptidase [Phycisphaerales bacterium]